MLHFCLIWSGKWQHIYRYYFIIYWHISYEAKIGLIFLFKCGVYNNFLSTSKKWLYRQKQDRITSYTAQDMTYVFLPDHYLNIFFSPHLIFTRSYTSQQVGKKLNILSVFSVAITALITPELKQLAVLSLTRRQLDVKLSAIVWECRYIFVCFRSKSQNKTILRI